MASLPHQITFDCADAYTLAQFWSQVFERPLHDDDNPGDPMALIEFEAGPGVLFIGVPEGKSVKNRLHLDVMPTDRTRDEEVQRLLGVGATLYEDHRRDDGTGWVTMLDPEGNEFCVERSRAERAG
jgi:predicted enzyme related to lactoylglutathione lyase